MKRWTSCPVCLDPLWHSRLSSPKHRKSCVRKSPYNGKVLIRDGPLFFEGCGGWSFFWVINFYSRRFRLCLLFSIFLGGGGGAGMGCFEIQA